MRPRSIYTRTRVRTLLRLCVVLLAVVLPMPVAKSGAYLSGSNTCPASGAKQVSSTQIKATWVSIQAPSTNSGKIYFGGSTVSTSEGNYITAGGVNFFPPVSNSSFYDLRQIYFACGNSADTITISYAQ